MTSRNIRTVELRERVEKEWSNHWLKNILLNDLLDESQHQVAYVWNVITSNINTTIELIEENIEYPWHWRVMSQSLIKSIDFIRRHPNLPYDWVLLSWNTNISLNDIDTNLDLPWSFGAISSRSDLTLEFVGKHFEKMNTEYLSDQPILWDDIEKNPERYHLSTILENPRITLDFIEKNIEKFQNNVDGELMTCMQKIARMKIVTLDFIERHIHRFNGYWLSFNPNVTIEFIKKHYYEPLRTEWDMKVFSEFNPSVTPELVQAYPNIEWDWHSLSMRSNFSPKDYPDFPWNWCGYSRNENFSFEYVPEDMLHMLDWRFICSSKPMTISDITKYSKYIYWAQLTKNDSITMDMIKNNPQFEWDYGTICMNKNCDLATIKKNKKIIEECSGHPTYFYRITGAVLLSDKLKFIEQKCREHLAAYRIQQHWNLVKTNPNYELCRKKLDADWNAYSASLI